MEEKGIDLRELFAKSEEELKELGLIHVDGWVKTNRNNGKIGFLHLHDGTSFQNLQIVYSPDLANFDEVSHYRLGAAVSAYGKIVLTPGMQQPFELHAESISLLGNVDQDYPLQKKKTSFEFLRDEAYLRPRTNTFDALYRVRSVLAMAIHTFFQDRGFVYVHTPIITGNDAEGAGQVFGITTDSENPATDFFGRKASLTVSGQLHVEAFALAFKNVYTFGPTFRAEKSNTPRHASEFWMIEPEIAFADLEDDMNLVEDMIKFCIDYVLERCPDEMSFFNKWIDTGLLKKLEKVRKSPFKRLEYTEGIELLKKAVRDGHKFENNKIEWGMDLQSEHERYLTEEIIKGPVFLINYPKEIKAFYMRLNDDGKTVAACDLLVPGEGEIVGGSQREERYDILASKMEELGNKEGLDWYLNLRRYGGCKHAGFGLGFDRFLMYITGVANIRDTEPYPRTANALKY